MGDRGRVTGLGVPPAPQPYLLRRARREAQQPQAAHDPDGVQLRRQRQVQVTVDHASHGGVQVAGDFQVSHDVRAGEAHVTRRRGQIGQPAGGADLDADLGVGRAGSATVAPLEPHRCVRTHDELEHVRQPHRHPLCLLQLDALVVQVRQPGVRIV
jgi:hypothetical protein